MADIRAFRAFRYDLGHVGPLADVVAPPYDVIDPALQQRLYDKSAFNVVRADFGKAAPRRSNRPDQRLDPSHSIFSSIS